MFFGRILLSIVLSYPFTFPPNPPPIFMSFFCMCDLLLHLNKVACMSMGGGLFAFVGSMSQWLHL